MSVADVIRVLQFGDSVLPVGAFAFSNGLETAVHERHVQSAQDLRAFVHTACSRAAASDGIALLEAHRAAGAEDLARAMRADHAAYNRKLGEEARTMSVRMGKKLAEIANHVLARPIVGDWLARINEGATPGCYPISLGVTFAAQGLAERDAFAVHQYGVAAMMLNASLRLMRIGYAQAQSILYEVNATAEAEYERYSGCTLDDMATFAPVMDILAAAHVQAHVRLFMS